MNIDMLVEELTRDEAVKLKPYRDTAGKLTIGIGRNLDDVGISAPEAFLLLKNDIGRAAQLLDVNLPWWRQMSDARQRALANMCFNLGIGGLLKFVNTLSLMKSGKFDDAADAMLNSVWAKQVGMRAKRLADLVRAG